jgi:hypothetical protein
VKLKGPDSFELSPALFDAFVQRLHQDLKLRGDHFRPSDWVARALCNVAGAATAESWYFTEWKKETYPSAFATGTKDAQTIDLKVDWLPDEDDESSILAIWVKGEPLSIFDALEKFDQGGGAFHEDAQRLVDFISQEVSKRLGIERRKRGRPMLNLGRRAALAHHHFGLSWGRVSRTLCPMTHKHTQACRENCRKQAAQYWERERKKYALMARRKPSGI